MSVTVEDLWLSYIKDAAKNYAITEMNYSGMQIVHVYLWHEIALQLAITQNMLRLMLWHFLIKFAGD